MLSFQKKHENKNEEEKKLKEFSEKISRFIHFKKSEKLRNLIMGYMGKFDFEIEELLHI